MDFLQNQIQKFKHCQEQGKPVQVTDEMISPEEIPMVITEALSQQAQATVTQMQEALPRRAVPDTVSQVFLSHCMGAYETLVKSLVEAHIVPSQ